MSKCISSRGEYSEHTPNAKFTCTRCFAFDEDAALDTLEASERNEAKAIKRAERAERKVARVTEAVVSAENSKQMSPLARFVSVDRLRAALADMETDA